MDPLDISDLLVGGRAQCSVNVTKCQPAACRQEGTAIRPGLRSRKNIGCCSRGGTKSALRLVPAQPELRGNHIDRLTGEEKFNDVVPPRPTSREPGRPESMIGIYGHVGYAVLREMDNLRVAIGVTRSRPPRTSFILPDPALMLL
jgi:hypothetical protein